MKTKILKLRKEKKKDEKGETVKKFTPAGKAVIGETAKTSRRFKFTENHLVIDSDTDFNKFSNNSNINRKKHR